jgi:hypothetical protein
MCVLETVVFLVRASGLDESQMGLVDHRPETRLDADQGHGLRSMECCINDIRGWHVRVCFVVVSKLDMLVERDEDAQLTHTIEVVAKPELEPITQVCHSG